MNYVTHMNMSHLGRRVCRATTTAQHTCTLALGTLNIPKHSLVLCSADQGPCQKKHIKKSIYYYVYYVQRLQRPRYILALSYHTRH